jgi:hypothetical protein
MGFSLNGSFWDVKVPTPPLLCTMTNRLPFDLVRRTEFAVASLRLRHAGPCATVPLSVAAQRKRREHGKRKQGVQ